MQAMYGPLTRTSTSVQREGEQLPTFEQLAQRVQANMKITVRDVWGLMLTALPGGLRVTLITSFIIGKPWATSVKD